MRLEDKVAQYLEFCRYRKELDEKTLKAYRIDLRQYFTYLASDVPLKEQIEEYITYLHRKYKQKTVKRKIASVKAFYNYLEDVEIIAENPFHKIKVRFKEKVTLPRIIPREEIEHILNHIYKCLNKSTEKSRRYILRDVAVVELFFATGARVYEISNIKEDCVDLHTGLIRIMGKGGKERYVQISNTSVLYILKQYFDEYTKQAGIKRNITPHMFRHSFATYLIEEGVDISCVQQILGHSSIRTTQIYIHIAAKKQAEILRELHPRNKMKIAGAA